LHTDSLDFDVNVDKENHEIRFLKKEVSPAKLSCTRNTNINIDLINTGESDEEVTLTVTATDLGYNKVVDFDLVEDVDDDENEYSFTDSLNLANTKPGTYTIKIHAAYNNNRASLDDTLTLEVEQCPTDVEEEEEEPVQTPATTTTQTTQTTTTTQPVQTQPTTVEVVSAPATTSSYVRPSQLVATPRTDYNESWWDKNKWLMIILITDLVLVIAGIIVIMAVLKRRR
ncbi:hypothetical protein KY363_07910, partial [Candidatus Woesearchaeota archaeon]|nr:hypothetical protein [Candidatus Woesearchaeota archaeon]